MWLKLQKRKRWHLVTQPCTTVTLVVCDSSYNIQCKVGQRWNLHKIVRQSKWYHVWLKLHSSVKEKKMFVIVTMVSDIIAPDADHVKTSIWPGVSTITYLKKWGGKHWSRQNQSISLFPQYPNHNQYQIKGNVSWINSCVIRLIKWRISIDIRETVEGPLKKQSL